MCYLCPRTTEQFLNSFSFLEILCLIKLNTKIGFLYSTCALELKNYFPTESYSTIFCFCTKDQEQELYTHAQELCTLYTGSGMDYMEPGMVHLGSVQCTQNQERFPVDQELYTCDQNWYTRDHIFVQECYMRVIIVTQHEFEQSMIERQITPQNWKNRVCN